ncbi:MAG: hypothetical protein WBX25_06875 [Rhodomicrobium sp.]
MWWAWAAGVIAMYQKWANRRRLSRRNPERTNARQSAPELGIDTSKLDEIHSAYKAAVEKWIAAIKEEEALASVNHTITEMDKWEAAHFKEEEIRREVNAAKIAYEHGLRERFLAYEQAQRIPAQPCNPKVERRD